MSATRRERGNARTTRVRQIIVDTAAGLLVREGAGAVTAVRIAEDTGVARTTICRYWPDPTALLLDAIDRVVRPHIPLRSLNHRRVHNRRFLFKCARWSYQANDYESESWERNTGQETAILHAQSPCPITPISGNAGAISIIDKDLRLALFLVPLLLERPFHPREIR